MEPKIYEETFSLGDLSVLLEGEQYDKSEIQDTRVSINGEGICWILWEDREQFKKELTDTINKYRI